MAYAIVVSPARVGGEDHPETSEAFVKRLAANTPSVKPAISVDANGEPVLIYGNLPTVAHLGHAGTGIRNSAKDFWKIIRETHNVPAKFSEIPHGSLYVKVIDSDGVFRAKLNPKTKPEKGDAYKFLKVGVYRAETAQLHKQKPRSRNIGQFGIREMLKVVVDGR